MSQEAWKNKLGDDEDVQMPLGTGDGGASEEYSKPPRAKPNGSTVALILSFGLALGALYVLGLTNKPRKVSADEIQKAKMLDEAWGRALAAISDKHSGVPRTLRETRSLVEMLTRYFEGNPEVLDIPDNPFGKPRPVIAAAITDTTPIAVGPPPRTEEEVRAAEELRAAALEFSGLRLQMVMLGNPTVALVNDKIVQVGTKFDYLTVDEIQSNAVILKHKDKRYELKAPQTGGKR